MKPWTTPEEKAQARARLAEIDTALEALGIEARTLAYVLALPDAPDRASRLAPMLAALRALPDGSPVRELAKVAKWGYHKAYLVLQDLVSYGLVEHYARGKYRLAELTVSPTPAPMVCGECGELHYSATCVYSGALESTKGPTPINCIRCGYAHYPPTCSVI